MSSRSSFLITLDSRSSFLITSLTEGKKLAIILNRNSYELNRGRVFRLAKKSKIAKLKKQEAMVEKYRDLRQELKDKHDYEGLAKLPRDASPTRLRNRDRIDGRPHGYMRKFGLSRLNFRKYAHQGKIPGVKKASW